MKPLARASAYLAVTMALGAGLATADEPSLPAGDVISVKADRAKLTVLKTDGGHYVVVESGVVNSPHLYFGNAKKLYQQRSQGGAARRAEKVFSRRFWAPRHQHQGYIDYRDGAWTIRCGKRKTPLEEVTGDAASQFLDKAVFHKRLWTRQAYALARDDRGNYYFVDKLIDSKGGRGFRVFVGKKGRMKQQSMVDVVFDSEGAIFATKRGKLRLIVDNADKNNASATWVRGKKRRELVPVPLWENLYLIYEDLGVYEGQPLGIPCDFYRE